MCADEPANYGPTHGPGCSGLGKGHSARRASVCPKDEARPTADRTGSHYMGLCAFSYKQCSRRLRGNRQEGTGNCPTQASGEDR